MASWRWIVVVVVASTCALAWPSRAAAWVTRLDPLDSSSGSTTARDVAVAADGTVFAAGGDTETPTFFDSEGKFTVVALAPATGVVMWRYEGGFGVAWKVAVDAAGGVIAVGSSSSDGHLVAVKLDAATGGVTWRRDVLAVGYDADLTPAGDVLVAGAVADGGVALKLAAADGAILWQHVVDPASPAATVVRALVGGDVAVVTLGVVVALAGTDGAERWRHARPTSPYQGLVIVAIGSGDVVVAGAEFESPYPVTGNGYAVVRLSGADGTAMWTYDDTIPTGLSQTARLALHPSGDVIVVESAGVVVRVDGATGTTVWRRTVGCPTSAIGGVAVDAAGDVRVAAVAPDCVQHPDPSFGNFTELLVANLASGDGVERWRRIFDGPEPGTSDVRAVSLSPPGNLLIAGQRLYEGVHDLDRRTRFQVLSLEGEGALDICHDGHVDAGEDCDAGADYAPCCTSSCSFEIAACDDQDGCTIGDSCVQGVCRPGNRVQCEEPCATCNSSSGRCVRPDVACLMPTASEKATLDIGDKKRSRRDTITWKWTSGQATSKSEFGDPVAGAGYALCMYAADPNAPVPLMMWNVPGNAGCPSGARCWAPTPRGWAYRARVGKPDGIGSVSLRPGPAGRASIVLQGRGSALALPPLPMAGPVTMALVKADGSGACWQATHDLFRTNDIRRFVATNR